MYTRADIKNEKIQAWQFLTTRYPSSDFHLILKIAFNRRYASDVRPCVIRHKCKEDKTGMPNVAWGASTISNSRYLLLRSKAVSYQQQPSFTLPTYAPYPEPPRYTQRTVPSLVYVPSPSKTDDILTDAERRSWQGRAHTKLW